VLALERNHPTAQRRGLMLLVQVAGLFATGWIVWSAAVAPRLGRLPLAGIVAGALKYTLLACLWSLAITLGLYLILLRPARADTVRIALRTCATAVWFAPAMILLSELSPAVLCAALVLIVSTTRLLYSQWRLIPAAIAIPEERFLFEPPQSRFCTRDLVPAFTASFSFQAGLFALSLGYSLLAAFAFCLSVAMVTLSLLVAGIVEAESRTSLPRSVLGVLLTIILAAGLTVGGLIRPSGRDAALQWGLPSRKHPGLVESTRAMLEKLLQNKPVVAPPQSVTKLYSPRGGNIEISDKSFPGVILWPQMEPPKPLVAPSPLSFRSSLTPEKPSSIRFTGEYWMFRPEFVRPPQSSYSRRASPLDLSFVTTDHASMHMEAYQKLAHPIDLSCCDAIQMEISNMDRFPGTVALELILIDTQSAAWLSQSLGKSDVTSISRLNFLRESIMPVPETLNFPIPRGAGLQQFDEIKIVFHRDRLRVDRSARISIERFVLLPR